jgi:hypothetical protein
MIPDRESASEREELGSIQKVTAPLQPPSKTMDLLT